MLGCGRRDIFCVLVCRFIEKRKCTVMIASCNALSQSLRLIWIQGVMKQNRIICFLIILLIKNRLSHSEAVVFYCHGQGKTPRRIKNQRCIICSLVYVIVLNLNQPTVTSGSQPILLSSKEKTHLQHSCTEAKLLHDDIMRRGCCRS